MFKSILILIISTSVFAIEFAPNMPGDYKRGYKDGYGVLSIEMFKKEFIEIQNATTTKDRYVARAGSLTGALKGTCSKYTYSDITNKSTDYISGFEKGCFAKADEIYKASFNRDILLNVAGKRNDHTKNIHKNSIKSSPVDSVHNKTFLDCNYISLKHNKHGSIMTCSNKDVLYLGKDCDVFSKKYGKGTWGWANGGSRIEFSKYIFAFPRHTFDTPYLDNCKF